MIFPILSLIPNIIKNKHTIGFQYLEQKIFFSMPIKYYYLINEFSVLLWLPIFVLAACNLIYYLCLVIFGYMIMIYIFVLRIRVDVLVLSSHYYVHYYYLRDFRLVKSLFEIFIYITKNEDKMET